MCCPQYTQRLHLCLTARITCITGDVRFQLNLPLIFIFFTHEKNILWIWLQSFYYFELVLTSCKVNCFKDPHWFDTCEVLFPSRPTEVVSKVINASVSQIRSWRVMTQWSAVRIYSLLLMRMNLFSRSLPETRRLKDHKCTCCFSCFAMSSIKLQSCYCWCLNASHAATKSKCLGSAKRWIVLSSLGKSLLELGVGCAWSCRKGKSFPDLNAPPNLTSLHVRSCAVKWRLDTFLCSCTPPAWDFPAPCLSQACPSTASPESRNAALTLCQGGRRMLAGKSGGAARLRFCTERWMAQLLLRTGAERGWGNAHRAVVDHDQAAGCEKRHQVWCRGHISVGARWLRERVRQVLEAAVPEWGMNICERLQHYRACFTAQLHF